MLLLSSKWHKTCMKEPANTQHNTQHKKAIFTLGLCMKKSILALSLLVGLSAAASSYAALPETVRIGTDTTYAPFSSKDAKGDFVGFDIDLGNEMCKRMQVKCT